MSELSIAVVVGSLRQGSLNRALARALPELAPSGMVVEEIGFASLPHYNGDLDTETPPAVVSSFRQRLSSAHGILIVTPEFNHGIPGVLKNAIDWASRPAFRSPFASKAVGMMTVTPSAIGGARAQILLHTVLFGMGAHVFPHPGFCLGRAHTCFDDQLKLTDARTQKFRRGLLAELWQIHRQDALSRFD